MNFRGGAGIQLHGSYISVVCFMFANATNNKTRQKYKEFDNNRMKGKK
jgi:hypothetical protein